MPALPARDAEDAVLVERLRSDETGDAMRALYRHYGGELYGFTLNALGDRGTAEEVVQEVFLRAWRHAGRYDPERAAVRTWLYQIARNAIIDSRRRAAVRPGLPQHEPVEELEGGASLEQAMLGWQVAAALERLTPEHRQMIRMAQFRGLTMREIAAHTGLPLGTVKSRTWYALRSLRLVLEEMGVTPNELHPHPPGGSAPTCSRRSNPTSATPWRRTSSNARTARPSTSDLAGMPALLVHAEGLEIPEAPPRGRRAGARRDRARARRGPPVRRSHRGCASKRGGALRAARWPGAALGVA